VSFGAELFGDLDGQFSFGDGGHGLKAMGFESWGARSLQI
jgi:hypothetical protein